MQLEAVPGALRVFSTDHRPTVRPGAEVWSSLATVDSPGVSPGSRGAQDAHISTLQAQKFCLNFPYQRFRLSLSLLLPPSGSCLSQQKSRGVTCWPHKVRRPPRWTAGRLPSPDSLWFWFSYGILEFLKNSVLGSQTRVPHRILVF